MDVEIADCRLPIADCQQKRTLEPICSCRFGLSLSAHQNALLWIGRSNGSPPWFGCEWPSGFIQEFGNFAAGSAMKLSRALTDTQKNCVPAQKKRINRSAIGNRQSAITCSAWREHTSTSRHLAAGTRYRCPRNTTGPAICLPAGLHRRRKWEEFPSRLLILRKRLRTPLLFMRCFGATCSTGVPICSPAGLLSRRRRSRAQGLSFRSFGFGAARRPGKTQSQ